MYEIFKVTRSLWNTFMILPSHQCSHSALRSSRNVTSCVLAGRAMRLSPSVSTRKMSVSDGWHAIGDYSVFAWSLSGLETCVVIKSLNLKPIAFDIGYSILPSIHCDNVFISHGHLDHVGGVVNHASKRGLFGLKKANYYVPPALVDHLLQVTTASHAMSPTTDALNNMKILPLECNGYVQLSSEYSVRAFPTMHRVSSQGYILYRTVKILKPEYTGKPSTLISEMHRKNADIYDTICTPEVAYTGDTLIDVFLQPPTPDLLRVKLLVMECTYLDQSPRKDMIKLARDRGHIHLRDIAKNAHIFSDVGSILLMHFSAKYTAHFVHQQVSNNIGSLLKDKVICATVAKEKMF